MSSPLPPDGIASAATICVGASSVTRLGDDDVGGQHDLVAGLVEEAPAVVDLVGLEQRVADVVPLRGQEGEAHPAADEQPVDLGQQRLDHRELVADLRAAEHDDVRALRVAGQPAQHRQLVADEVAAVVRQQFGDVVDRGVLAVHGAERVLTNAPPSSSPPVRNSRQRANVAPLGVVLARLARVEPDVLEQQQLAVLQVGRRAAGRSRRRCRARTRPAGRAAGRAGRRPGCSEYCGSGAPFGRPRCAATITRAPWSSSRVSTGSDARIRPSSVTLPSWIGTLRSERTRMRRPLTPCLIRSSSVFMRSA